MAVPFGHAPVFPYPYVTFPLPSFPTSTHSLPTTSHIPLLNGQADFSAWHDGIKALIRNLGSFGHVASLADPVPPDRLDMVPSFPPALTPTSPPEERLACTRWWDLDNTIEHVLLARLGSSARMVLPEDGSDRTARLIYETLKANFGLNQCSEGTNIFLALLAARCHPHRICDYVMTWQNTVTKMRGCRFNLPRYVLALLFVKNLPESMAFGSLRSHLNTCLENVTEADMGIFKEILRDAVELDTQFRSTSSLVNNRTAPSLLQPRSQSSGQRPPHSSSTLSG